MKEDDEQMEDNKERIRFQKAARPIDQVKEDSYGCIAEAFTWFHLDDFREELQYWLRIALINDQSAYDEGSAREDVMDFCDELQTLLEALHIINENRKSESTRKLIERLPDDLREEMRSYNQPELLTEEQKTDPKIVIKGFCSAFTLSYVRRELWDLMDSVVFYEKECNTQSSDPHAVYKCLLALVEAVYFLFQDSVVHQPGGKNTNTPHPGHRITPALSKRIFSHAERLQAGNEREFEYPDDPYIIIYDYFGDSTIGLARKQLQHVLKLAFSKDIELEENDIFQSLYWLKTTGQLIEAGYRIYETENLLSLNKKKIIYDGLEQQITGFWKKAGGWDLCPAYLDFAEWKEPRLAIKDFVEYQPLTHWRAVLYHIVQAATNAEPGLPTCLNLIASSRIVFICTV